jgi:hypothetical protein
MKTKIFGGATIVAIAVVVTFNVSLSKQTSNQASQLVLDNVEALAQSEEVIEPIENRGKVGIPTTVQCSRPGQQMSGGLRIDCFDFNHGSCEPFDPCNF